MAPPASSRLLHFLPLFFLLCLPPPCFAALSLRRQAEILVSMKESFLPTPALQSWSMSASARVCSAWAGVRCDAARRSVVALDISNCNISGALPPAVGGLPALEFLSVAGNSLSGELPAALARLRSLAHLNISNNQFNGTLAGLNFSAMAALQVLDVYDNDLGGPLPAARGLLGLPRLRHLDLSGNYFSGGIPASYGEFKSIEFLSLAGNSLAGPIPAELGNLTSLQQLMLGYYNKFDGGIPPELGKLPNLVHLDLSSCGLEGEIPPELGALKMLDTLYLQTNQLFGEMPPQFGNLTSLAFLDVSNNALTGDIPRELAALKALKLINLFMNRFRGGIPDFVAGLPRLEVLKLWQNNFTGAIPAALGRGSPLREVDLSSNRLTGEVPPGLCERGRLQILILLDNYLLGPVPKGLGACATLARVRLGQNYLTGPLPRGFLYLPALSTVELQNNYLAGEFPDDPFGTPRKLALLNLSNNRFNGSLPASIGNFSSLQTLLVGGNQFAGEIPRQIGQLKRLLKLDMGGNNLSGAIPRDIGGCSSLTYLDLSLNQLSGAMPAQLAQIKILNYLNVSWNKLSQTIPWEIGGMKSLTSADFSHNDFSGRVPETGQFACFNTSAFVGNPRLCGWAGTPCNSSSEPTQLWPDSSRRSGPKGLIGRLKLFAALGLLACSVAFAVAAVVTTRSAMLRRRRAAGAWKMTAFQKVAFGCDDVVQCLKENCVVGRGGAGVVYRGTMPRGERVAVKRILGVEDGGFSAEVQTLGKIRHRHIVRLLAFCSSKEANLLVYEYMVNGSLGELLHGKRGEHLSWAMRLRIATEAAKGLCYLHHDCCPPILHRDVKSNNILLDADFEAHVADFGLAKYLRANGTSECMSAIAGSYGYIAPEYAYTLKVDEKSDVYSFGVVLLELITGRKPVGDFGEEGLDLVQWARICTSGNKAGVMRVLDPRLSAVPQEEAMQMFFVSMLCVQEHSVERPTMREVVQMLEQARQLPSPLLRPS